MKLVKINPSNIFNYENQFIIFKTRNEYKTRKILKISKSGKTVTIDLPDLKNCLEITSRNVYVILD